MPGYPGGIRSIKQGVLMLFRFSIFAAYSILLSGSVSYGEVVTGVSGVGFQVYALSSSSALSAGQTSPNPAVMSTQSGTINTLSVMDTATAEFTSGLFSAGLARATASVTATWDSATAGNVVIQIETASQLPTLPFSRNSSHLFTGGLRNEDGFHSGGFFVHTFTPSTDGIYRIDYKLSRTLLGDVPNPGFGPTWSWAIYENGFSPGWFGRFNESPNPYEDGSGSIELGIFKAGSEYQIGYSHSGFQSLASGSSQFSKSGTATFDWQFTAVPEPNSTLILLSLGVPAVLARVRSRTRRSSIVQ